jgi:putative transferase (TIGR04331 family)
VIHWNERHWELRDSARGHFQLLQAVGIFHATPESAAKHIAAVWHDVDAWWNSAPVQQARATFQANYCARPADLDSRIEAELRAVARS